MIGIPGLSIPRRRRRASFTGAYDAVPSIVAAYGMRRLRTAYTGSLLRMRRSSDNAESDFGYTGSGDLDTAAITSWLGGSSGYIVTWYDQSGNGYDATQSTAASQPLYVASGQNGRPVLRWDGVNYWLGISNWAITFTAQTTMAVFLYSGVTSYMRIFTQSDAGNDHDTTGHYIPILRDVTNNNIGSWAGSSARESLAAAQSVVMIFSAIHNGTSLINYRNGAGSAGYAHTLNKTFTRGRIGANFTPSGHLNGDIAELIICNAALSTGDRQAAETAANDYWSIY